MADRPPVRGYLGVTRRPTRREWRGAIILFVVGVVGLVLALLFVHPHASLLAVGSSAPRISLQDSEGATVTAGGADTAYVVEFFQPGCSHCQQTAAQLCALRVPVFAVDAGADSADTVNAYRRQYAPACTHPMLLDPALSTTKSYAVSAVPTVYLVVGGRIAYAGAGLDGIAGLTGAIDKAAHG